MKKEIKNNIRLNIANSWTVKELGLWRPKKKK